MAYASALLRDPYATYRQIDVAGRTADGRRPRAGPVALRGAGRARCAPPPGRPRHRQFAIKSERVTRATAILFALEAGLDFDGGGEVSNTLARLYAGARRQIVDAAIGSDPAPVSRRCAEPRRDRPGLEDRSGWVSPFADSCSCACKSTDAR